MKKYTVLTLLSTAAFVLSACSAETPSETTPAAEPTLAAANRAAIDNLPPLELVDVVRHGKGAEFEYADNRLAELLKTTTDAKLVEAATEPRLPFGNAMYQANLAKDRIKKQ